MFEYLIVRVAEADDEARAAWKHWRDRSLQKDNSVRVLQYRQVSPEKGAFRGRVLPAQSKSSNDEKDCYYCWVIVDTETLRIDLGDCSCYAG